MSRGLFIAVSSALVVTTLEAAAHAQTPAEQMLAQSLFDEGRALMDQKRYAEACPKLAESQRLDPGGGTLLNLGICHELEGRLATASMELNAALSQARKDGRQDRVDIASTHLGALDGRIPRLTIRVAPQHEAEEGLEVFLDGTPVRRPAWNVTTMVDPGIHVVDARAPGEPTPFRMTVELPEREQRVIDVAFARSSPPPLPASPHGTGAFADAPARSARRNPVHTAGVVTGIAGFVVAGVASVGWLVSKVERSEACNEERHYCTPDGLAAADRERTFGWTTVIASTFGAAGLVVAASVPEVVFGVSPARGGAALGMTARF